MPRFSPLLAVMLLGLGASVQAQLVEDMERKLEAQLLQRLASVQSDPTQSLAPFQSDGCSGGLSQGWQAIAELFPSFRKKYGNQPPWQSCCIEHDRSYWRGEVEQGYAKRKLADERLRLCVIGRGKANSRDTSAELGLSPEQVEKAYQIAAELMYQAVRLGGRPCSVFEWRWGYGWSACPIMLSP